VFTELSYVSFRIRVNSSRSTSLRHFLIRVVLESTLILLPNVQGFRCAVVHHVSVTLSRVLSGPVDMSQEMVRVVSARSCC
jgi:hypothetical protein